jgi:aminopeptidase YwaD
VKSLIRLLAALAVVPVSFSVYAQQSWTVKPEWVIGDELFLSSDVLAGRGSATRDEELTATYVASEFESYGLKAAPGMTGFLQSAEVVAPKLDGKATLQVGETMLEEGRDFALLTSPGNPVSGTVVKVAASDGQTAHVPEGSAVVITGAADMNALLAAMTAMRRQHAVVILIPETAGVSALPQMFGGETRVGVRLAEDPPRKSPTVILLHGDGAAQFAGGNATQVTVTVHEMPQTNPRQTFNAIGYLAGTDPGAGTILLTAHLDHLGIGRAVNGDSIYNGANDDAAGTTAVLELAHALAAGPRPRRSVLFVCYGSEEMGELGST